METKSSSKKISIIAAILILLTGVILGGYLVLKSGRLQAGQLDDILKNVSLDPALCEPDASDANKDADSDGLKDWQEIQLYQSNPCKIDTDGDGYLDGEEIASGYNPIVKAPGDELPGTIPKGPRPLPENLTRALSSMLAQQIVSGKIESFNQQGGILSSYELSKYPGLQQSVQQIVSAGSQLFAPDPLDESQIKTSSDNSRFAIQNFAAQSAQALSYEKNPTIQTSDSEAAMLQKAIEQNDTAELEFAINNLQTAYQRLKTLTVPSELLSLHIEQLNIYSSTLKIYGAVRTFDSDPLKANLALQEYVVVRKQFGLWLQKLGQFVTKHQ